MSSIKHATYEACFAPNEFVLAKFQKTMRDNIVFRKRDSTRVEIPTTDPLVITAQIGAASVQKVLIDSESSVNIIFKAAYDQMKLETKDLKPCRATIHGFNGASSSPVGVIALPMELGEGDQS